MFDLVNQHTVYLVDRRIFFDSLNTRDEQRTYQKEFIDICFQYHVKALSLKQILQMTVTEKYPHDNISNIFAINSSHAFVQGCGIDHQIRCTNNPLKYPVLHLNKRHDMYATHSSLASRGKLSRESQRKRTDRERGKHETRGKAEKGSVETHQ